MVKSPLKNVRVFTCAHNHIFLLTAGVTGKKWPTLARLQNGCVQRTVVMQMISPTITLSGLMSHAIPVWKTLSLSHPSLVWAWYAWTLVNPQWTATSTRWTFVNSFYLFSRTNLCIFRLRRDRATCTAMESTSTTFTARREHGKETSTCRTYSTAGTSRLCNQKSTV